MSDAADGEKPSEAAWQPFTFRGLAVIAESGTGLVLLAALLTAMAVAAATIYFLHRDYSPVIEQAIQEMPPKARIEQQKLIGADDTVVATSRFLGIAVTPEPSDPIGQSADVQIQLRPANFRIGTIFRPDWGLEFPYDHRWSVDMSQKFLEPWWGAWQPVLLTSVGLAMLLTQLLIWSLLATVYCLPVKCLGWFADRRLDWGGAWALSMGSVLVGAVVMTFGLLLYTWHWVDLLGLAFFFVLHPVVHWVYLIGGTLRCPKNPVIIEKPNPFISS